MNRVADVMGVFVNHNEKVKTMSDLEQIIAGETAELAPVESQPETPVEEPQEQAAEQPEAEKSGVEDPQEEPKEEPRQVPLAALLDERDKRQALESRVSEMERTMKQPDPDPAPDIFEDPNGYSEYLSQQIAAAQQNTTLNMSQAMAEQTHGKEAVAQAFEAFQAANNPAVIQQVMQAPMPYMELVNWHTSQKAMSEIGPDPVAWATKERERIRAEIKAEMATEQAKAMAAQAAPSMANVTGSGGSTSQSQWAGPTPLEKVVG